MTMWKPVIFGLAAVAALSGGAPLLQAQSDEAFVVPFSDPSRPGKVIVEVFSGGITVRGENRRDVAIQSGGGVERPARPVPPNSPSAGLRRLTQAPGFTVEEERNEIKVEGMSLRRRGSAFDLRVPTRTSLKLEAVNDGTRAFEFGQAIRTCPATGGSTELRMARCFVSAAQRLT